MDLKYELYRIIFSNKVYNLLLRPFDRLLYPLVDVEALKRRRETEALPLHKIANTADLANPAWQEVLRSMAQVCAMDENSFHRKTWEYVHIVYTLRSQGYLHPDNRGLAIGAGRESVLYYLAANVDHITGIDLYEGKYLGGEDERDIPQHPQKYAPFLYPDSHLALTRMDSRALTFSDESFDFLFSASSIEHFGSRVDIERSIGEMFRVLKPGGACVITTELKLNKLGTRIPNTRILPLAELVALFNRCGFQLAGEDVDIQLEDRHVRHWVVLPHGLYRRPHVVLRFFNTVFTSVLFFLVKPGRGAGRGEWRAGVETPPFRYRYDLQVEAEKGVYRKGDVAHLNIRVKNTGNFDWFTDGYSHRVALGVQLLDPAGELIDQNHADLAIPQPVAAGRELMFQADLPLRLRRGKYKLLFDLKRELITWFAPHGNQPVNVDVEIT